MLYLQVFHAQITKSSLQHTADTLHVLMWQGAQSHCASYMQP